MDNLEQYRQFGLDLAKEMGQIMFDRRQQGYKSNIKADKTLVTEVDIEINDKVIAAVQKEFDHPVFGEEDTRLDNKNEYLWVCDPIDGTVQYDMGLPLSTFSLALTKSGQTLFGVVYNPFTNEIFSALSGQGAFLNENKISARLDLLGYQSIIALESWKGAEFQFVDLFKILTEETDAWILNLGSAAYAACLVASGRYHAYIFPGTKNHVVDVAAAGLIVKEAGGIFTNVYGQEDEMYQDIQGAVFSNSQETHKLLLEKVKRVL